MKGYILSVVLILTIGRTCMAQDIAIPDFVKVNEHDRFDSINRWFVSVILLPRSNDGEQSLNNLTEYANQKNDLITKLAAKFYTGHYTYVLLKKDEGLAIINDAIDGFKKARLDYEWAFAQNELARIYYRQNNFGKSLELQIRSYNAFKQLKFERKPEILILTLDLGHLYYDLGNYAMCLNIFLPAQKYLDSTSSYSRYFSLQVTNTIGLCYRNLEKPDSALLYFERTFNLAHTYKNNAWIGISSGNIGYLYLLQGKNEIAQPYFNTYYNTAITSQDDRRGPDISDALMGLAQINLNNYKTDEALAQLKKAEQVLTIEHSPSKRLKRMKKKMYQLLCKAYLLKKDPSNALSCYTIAAAIEDSLGREDNIAQYSNIQIQLEAEKNIAQLRQLETETKLSIQQRNFSWVAIILGALILFILYRNQRIRHTKDKELLLLEKMLAEEQLTAYMESLHEKNKLIEEFQEKLDQLALLSDSSKKLQTFDTLDKLQKFTLITEDDWQLFKTMFDKVHIGFFKRLVEKYPDITQGETRLLALTKLNIPTKTMAGMLGISPESIRKARYRFLKKLHSSEGEEADLITIVTSI